MADSSNELTLLSINYQLFGRQADISWLHLSRKQDRHRRGRSVTDAFRQFLTINERKSHETSNSLSKSFALSQELQTQSCPPHPPGGEAAIQLSSEGLRSETTN